ncbi:class I SAM-dependent methyltransferase [Streptomyces venezuelae]|uniref:class I SAM-dependent methyltransferase n=1 Tax=Streptomyces venezuelae TaxID=54571 RepID=UPI00278C1574|nr:class I SAM-dependent methyltransferase [Streptomyces venezuelae]
MEQVRRAWRVAFGDVVEEYESARPDYPDALVDDVLAYAGGEPGMSVLEVGAGTGKATRAFAARGTQLTCLEPDPRMAARLAEEAGCGAATVHICDFEAWEASSREFGLLVSAQAWHWVDPELGWKRAHEVLRPGGAVALFWHLFKVADPHLRAGMVAAHRVRGLTGLDARVMEDWVRTPSVDRSVWPAHEMRARAEFTDVQYRAYPVTHTFTTERFCALLTTLSAYRMLEDGVRADLYAELADLVRRRGAGDRVEVTASTQLTLARTR